MTSIAGGPAGSSGSLVPLTILRRRDGAEVARMTVTSEAAQGMYDRVACDLATMSIDEFELEWGIAPG